MTALLHRRGLAVSHHFVDRLMRGLAPNGVRSSKKVSTTMPDPTDNPHGPASGPSRAGLHRPGPEPTVGRGLHLVGSVPCGLHMTAMLLGTGQPEPLLLREGGS